MPPRKQADALTAAGHAFVMTGRPLGRETVSVEAVWV
jgi:hypothetical protein